MWPSQKIWTLHAANIVRALKDLLHLPWMGCLAHDFNLVYEDEYADSPLLIKLRDQVKNLNISYFKVKPSLDPRMVPSLEIRWCTTFEKIAKLGFYFLHTWKILTSIFVIKNSLQKRSPWTIWLFNISHLFLSRLQRLLATLIEAVLQKWDFNNVKKIATLWNINWFRLLMLCALPKQFIVLSRNFS